MLKSAKWPADAADAPELPGWLRQQIDEHLSPTTSKSSERFFCTRKTELGYQVVRVRQLRHWGVERLTVRVVLNFLAHWSYANAIARDLNCGNGRLGIQYA